MDVLSLTNKQTLTKNQIARFLMCCHLLRKYTNDPINLQLNTRNEIVDKWIYYCKKYHVVKSYGVILFLEN